MVQGVINDTIDDLIGQMVGEVDWGRILDDPLIWEEKVLKTNLTASLSASGVGTLGPEPLWPLEGWVVDAAVPLVLVEPNLLIRFLLRSL